MDITHVFDRGSLLSTTSTDRAVFMAVGALARVNPTMHRLNPEHHPTQWYMTSEHDIFSSPHGTLCKVHTKCTSRGGTARWPRRRFSGRTQPRHEPQQRAPCRSRLSDPHAAASMLSAARFPRRVPARPAAPRRGSRARSPSRAEQQECMRRRSDIIVDRLRGLGRLARPHLAHTHSLWM